jgi:hypothetical protein
MTKASHRIVMSNGTLARLTAIVFVCGCSGSQAPGDAGSLLADAACSAGLGAPGEACGCGGACLAEAQCIQTRDHAGPVNVCTAISAGFCVCGAVLDDRCQNGTTCVCPSGSDDTGVCVTPEQKVVLCSSDLSKSFNCNDQAVGDAAPGTVP